MGTDFAGPLFAQTSSSSEGGNEKCYVCLFTCASTRTVYLELTRNITVDSFLLAFRRFTSRRGLPATLITDNAKTFRGPSKEIVKINAHILFDDGSQRSFITSVVAAKLDLKPETQ